jgi:hypothetical protein
MKFGQLPSGRLSWHFDRPRIFLNSGWFTPQQDHVTPRKLSIEAGCRCMSLHPEMSTQLEPAHQILTEQARQDCLLGFATQFIATKPRKDGWERLEVIFHQKPWQTTDWI